jgi:hypothetical protein
MVVTFIMVLPPPTEPINSPLRGGSIPLGQVNGKTEISTRTTYLFNGPDKNAKYHSGQEYYTEFNAARSISNKVALGINGSILKQLTDDKFENAVYENGYRARDFSVGP